MTSTTTGTSDSLRILQASPVFEPSVGGVQTAVREISKHLASREDITVEVLTADASGELAVKDRLSGIDVTRVQAWPHGGDQLFAPGAAAVVRSGGWDIVHVQCYHTLFSPLVMAAAARARIPYVVTFHGGGHSSKWRSSIRRRQLRAIRPLLARAAALVVTAEWEVEHYVRLLGIAPGRFVLIPNGGDLPPSPKRTVQVEGTLLVSMGRLERYKGHQHVIAALPQVIREVPDARLWVAGAGPYEDELRALATRLGVSDRVQIRAVPDRAAYGAELSAASAGIMLSDFESHPIAAVEALLLGLPMLVADNSGMSELAQNGYATAVATDAGPTAHAEAIVRRLREPAPEVSLEIKSWEERTDQLVALYRAVRHRNARARAEFPVAVASGDA